MSIQTWPDDLPNPERSTWQRGSQDVRRKRSPKAGAPGFGRSYSKAALDVHLSVVLNRHQKTVFDTFFHETCSEGAALFWMPDPTTHNWPLLASDGTPLLAADGRPLLMTSQWLCAWGDDLPTETIEGQVEFRKSFSVIVVPS